MKRKLIGDSWAKFGTVVLLLTVVLLMGASTTCNDTSTALTVAAGDVITISNSTSASETGANISVSFELWN